MDSHGNKRNDELTYPNFESNDELFYVDGNPLYDENHISKTSGSLIVTIKPAYLQGLENKEYTVTALFGPDEVATAKFTVTNAPSSSGKTYYIPKTGVE